MIGETISHYKILEKLSEGGMGVVYKAQDTKLKRTVALKFLLPELTRDPEAKKRFIHEAQAAAALSHPNICTIFEIDESEGQSFIAMEYIEGQDLKEKIAAGPMKLNEAIDIATQVAEGLHEAHEKSIVHRDIKPANIMMTSKTQVKIMDFGLAKLKGQTKLTKEGTTLGTILYMSPEQARGGEADRRSDIWSIGAFLYEMITGQHPFRGDYEQVVVYSIMNEEPEPITGLRTGVPMELERIVNKALEKSADERYQHMDEMLVDLRMLRKELEAGISLEHPVITRPQPSIGVHPLPFSGRAEEPVEVEGPVFVARENELKKLNGFLNTALAGKGWVTFVTGETGSGKTALVQEFAQRAQEAHPDLIVASGNCNAHTGIGDPYLPFREVMSLLTGDVEAKWTAGVITSERTTGLWNLLPLSVQALLDNGPDLIDVFVPGEALVTRAAAFAPRVTDWLMRLKILVKRKAAIPADVTLQQSNLFEQYTRVLQALARQHPLLLVLDDLQWADSGSISLLFHLGRRIASNRILIVGAYRPAEVALGRGGERHPLESILNEFKRDFGDFQLEVGETEDRQFIDAFLDTEPNKLSKVFRDTLFRHTRGHALFTVELLRDMQEQGLLVKDDEGQWIEGLELNWDSLPARVDAVVEERISRLTDRLREVLTLASVEGEEFTAEVVARLQETEVRQLVRLLSSDLEKRHHLVSAKGIRRIDSQRFSLYLFRHILFQRYLYNGLDEVERSHLHEEVGNVLETLYGEQADEIAVQLARHFQEAGIATKAIKYLHEAGNKAVRLSANEEAIAHFKKALELLKAIPDTPECAQQELTLQLALAVPLQAVKGFAAPELGRAITRARELCQQLGDTPQLFTAIVQLTTFYATRPEYRTALELTKHLNKIATQAEDPMLMAIFYYVQIWPLLNLGELVQALDSVEHMIAFYDPEQHGSLAFIYGYDLGVLALAFGAWALWFLGYPDQAQKQFKEAITLARKLDHPHTLAFALVGGCELHWFLRDIQGVNRYTEELIPISNEKGFIYWQGHGTFYDGERQFLEGNVREGIEQMRQGLATMRATGTETCLTRLLARVADACRRMGEIEEGLFAIAEATEVKCKYDERYMEAELYRLKGELLLMQGESETEVEKCFYQAIDVARQRQAKSLELRAAMSLSHLFLKQGKKIEARRLLEEIYGWFTEGFDTPDLKEAKALLEEL